MQIFYFRLRQGNFGDDLNAWIWDALVPGISSRPGDVSLCGIGTLLSDLMPRNRRWLVVGSGTGYSPPPDLTRGRWDFAAVRGPLTARVLGLPEETAVTDSAILVAALPDGSGTPLPEAQRHGIVFVPHWKQLRFGRWREVCEAAGVEFVSPQQDSREVLARLRSARRVLADAMHAAICSDTLRVPWVPLSISSENHTFKWLDWTAAMQLPYRPRELPPSSFLEHLQSRFAELLRTDYRLKNASMDQALAFHAQTLQRRGSIATALRRRVALYGVVLLKGVLKLPGLSALHRRLDERQFRKAVAAMREAALAPAFLSSPQVFETRLTEMQRRLMEGLHRADNP